MTTYATLTDAERATVNAFMTAYRPLMGQVSRMLAAAQGVIDAYDAGAGALISGLDANSTVADPTGLAGAQAVAREDIVTAISDLSTVIGAYNTAAKRQSRIKAAGLVNT